MAQRTDAEPPPVPGNPLTEAQAGYIAGFFDGEGSVILIQRKAKGYPRFTMCQRTPEVLERIQGMLGYGNLHSDVRDGGGTMWKLTINRREHKLHFIRYILPYSIVKREKLEQAKAWLTA
jgi:intein-encoded DNA endonuclease-like protein